MILWEAAVIIVKKSKEQRLERNAINIFYPSRLDSDCDDIKDHTFKKFWENPTRPWT